MRVFMGAVEQINGQHGDRQREQEVFQKQQETKCRLRYRMVLEESFGDAEKAAQHKNHKIVYKKVSAPTVDTGNDDRKPQSYQAKQQCRANDGET